MADLSQNLLDIVPQAILAIDSDGKLLAYNSAARPLLPADVTIGTRLETAAPRLAILLKDIDSQAGISRREVTLDDIHILEATVTPFPPQGWAITLYDISSYKTIVAQRNDLLNDVTHDLKQPVSAIISFSDVLRASGDLNAQQSQGLDRIRRAAVRMSEQINQLLDASRIEAGLSLAITDVDLVRLAKTTLDELAIQASAKHIYLGLEPPASAPILKGDSNRLGQVIDNLVLNAIKYSPTESAVTVKLWTVGDQVALSVTDEGTGIAPENIPHLFDRFFRVKNKQTRGIEGTGLGLYIVQTIVKQHGGTVGVDSELGVGSTFTVYLPLSGPSQVA